MEKEMRELYTEGVAIHGGPESCAVAREGGGTWKTYAPSDHSRRPEAGPRRRIPTPRSTEPASLETPGLIDPWCPRPGVARHALLRVHEVRRVVEEVTESAPRTG